uniref:Uncharacterized protein n=1 Tax=Arundo donax TaxID=35708 RepID=A0A0A9F6L4_ARUDO
MKEKKESNHMMNQCQIE